ncbi:MAG: dihydroorotate dehydrogenase electron transfer subunit [Bacteroidales bacterium]|jgi:dihydroorotate dehydrogenase electron transfer subunit
MHKIKKIIQDFEVAGNTNLNDSHYILTLSSPTELPEIFPGQFAEVLIPNSGVTFLRRPFSIFDVNYKRNELKFLIKCIGTGTAKLWTLKKGDMLNVMFPLGKSFNLDINGNAMLVGGGCGVAPLFLLAKSLHEKNVSINIFIGAKSKNDILFAKELKSFGYIFITTEDGSEGEKGLVTNHSKMKAIAADSDKIYCCGPEPMMKTIASIAKKVKVSCEVSLENTMACGIGACLCCVTETVEGNKCVCTEGPVFNTKSLKWQI